MNINNSDYTILIVDDVDANVLLLKLLISKVGYKTLTAYNGKEALSIIEQSKPDLILLDIVMPKMNGLTVCRIMKENPETKHIPIVFISAKTQKADIDEALKLGAEEYIIKPFNHEEIKSVIKKYI